ncbi:tyrosine-type recombinase/integrase [Kaistia terrae]|uniref:Tyrosine-type recombinase/integrase n=1 Tax=Kaistia terrae TaxID=537017 RepID=A0ABW0PV81_9HYPH|nr:site-specific integrase [Kaistia terrae]MCX5579439.1 site-specific integrase [Kaistia terrae]
MSIRKRTWTTAAGEDKTAWVVDYVDQGGKRRLKTFSRKKEADAFSATAKVEVREGVHVADSASATVATAGKLWVATAAAAGLERTTIVSYQSHLDLHIVPLIGEMRVSALSIPLLRAFEDDLRAASRSPAMIKKVMVSLGSLLADAQERGLTTRNAVRDIRGRRGRGENRQEKRLKGKLRVGADIPTREEVKALVGALSNRWRPLLLTAIFTGLRASELRGLRWEDVDLEKREIRVHRRADRFNAIGKPKSASSERTVPAPPIVINTLREWKLACPRATSRRTDPSGKPIMVLDLVFPNGAGKVEQLNNIVRRGLHPALLAAGVTIETEGLDEQGNHIPAPKYPGIHALRHFFASWCINRKEDGGLGLPPKVVQERMGHSTITMTMDTYGHLFPRGDDAAELAAAETALLG